MRTPRTSWLASRSLPAFALLTLLALAPAARAAGSPLRVQVEKSKVDLKRHRLEVKMSHPAGKVKITVVAASGAKLAEEDILEADRPFIEALRDLNEAKYCDAFRRDKQR